MQNKPNITLSTGRIVAHRPYLSNGVPNGATEAYLLDGDVMTDKEWVEYVKLSNPIQPKLYICKITLEDQSVVEWADYAEDLNHAEGLAIAWANEHYSQQVYDISTI